jgi:hypothetical protein
VSILLHSVDNLNVIVLIQAEVLRLSWNRSDDDGDPVGGDGNSDLAVEEVDRVVELAGRLTERIDGIVALRAADGDSIPQATVLFLLNPSLANEGTEGVRGHEGICGGRLVEVRERQYRTGEEG